MGCGRIIFGDRANGSISCGDANGHYNPEGKWVDDGGFWLCGECEIKKNERRPGSF